MQIAVLVSALLILAARSRLVTRGRFRGFRALRTGGRIREKIVRIDRLQCGFLTDKLAQEIKIFNRMYLVMPCRNGVPVLYSQFLGRLVLDSRWVFRGANDGNDADAGTHDAAAKLLYICAAANLYSHSKDALVRRQLLKNCTFVFGQTNCLKRTKSVVLSKQRRYTAHAQARFKYIAGKFVFDKDRIDRPSYTVYDKGKHCADKFLPVQCYETDVGKYQHFASTDDSVCGSRFSYFISGDKFKYNLSHTSDTFYAVGEGKAIGLYVPEKVMFGSSIAESGDALNIYAASEGEKYYIVNAKTKPEVTAIVGEIKRRRGRLDYLLNSSEAADAVRIENLFERAWAARCVRGEGLKEKYQAANKYVPTLFLPTLVYQIETPEDFFAVVDSFGLFRKIAATGNSFNLVFLYSSMNDEAREIIKVFTNKDEVRALIDMGVFVFFVDRIKANSKALNYLSLMSEPLRYRAQRSEGSPSKDVTVTTHISNSFPVTHTAYVRNTEKKQKTVKVKIPLEVGGDLDGLPFGMPSVCRREGANLQVTSLKSGRSVTYKLPVGASITDEFGRAVGEAEVASERVFAGFTVKLAAFEEKVLKIVKSTGALSRAERKQAFLGNIESVCVKGNPRLEKLFATNIIDGTSDKLVSALKDSVKNFEVDAFFALLSKRDKITSDVYAFLVECVLGIKLVRDKIQLMPKIAITGSFELSFKYMDTPYTFKVVECSGDGGSLRGSSFTVSYGGTEYKNFLQVSVK